jgi:transcriptional regulator with XRE-family HTH domain
MPNERLRTAMTNARVDIDQLARATRVDPKTVQRWLSGRVPHPRHRWKVSALVGQEEGYLWPTARLDIAPGAPATSEVVTAYAHRADIPNSVWNDLLDRACRQIDIIGYSFLFLPEQTVNLAKIVTHKCSDGCKVRIAIADPDSEHTQERDRLECLNGTLPSRVRTSINHLQPILEIPAVQVRYHETHLYSAIYRFDDEMVVTPYLAKAHGFEHPALHLRRLSPYGIFATYADHFESLWSTTKDMNDDAN